MHILCIFRFFKKKFQFKISINNIDDDYIITLYLKRRFIKYNIIDCIFNIYLIFNIIEI